MKKYLIIVLVTFILVGCGSSNKILGDWYSAEGNEIVKFTFNSDGTCEIKEEYEEDYNRIEKCTYNTEEEKITFAQKDVETTIKYKIEDDVLIIRDLILYRTIEDAEKGSSIEIKTITIPDVSGLTVEEAERVLESTGFVVDSETKKEYSDSVESGIVIGTDPAIGRKRAEGTRVTIIESLGDLGNYIIENYVGKNYKEVQTVLENVYKMKVIIQKKEVKSTDDIDPNKIIDQSLAEGTEIKLSEDNPRTITLYIPDISETYPDFVAEGWSIEQVQEFANKYDLVLTIKYEESVYKSGTIIKQSRTGKVVNGVSLTITVAK